MNLKKISHISIQEIEANKAPAGSLFLIPRSDSNVAFGTLIGLFKSQDEFWAGFVTFEAHPAFVPLEEVSVALLIRSNWRIVPELTRAKWRQPMLGDLVAQGPSASFLHATPLMSKFIGWMDWEEECESGGEEEEGGPSSSYVREETAQPKFVMPWHLVVGDDVIYSHPSAA